jgi:hypothetical protein
MTARTNNRRFLREAQDRLFALERRAQDDSKNKQPQIPRLRCGMTNKGRRGTTPTQAELGWGTRLLLGDEAASRMGHPVLIGESC